MYKKIKNIFFLFTFFTFIFLVTKYYFSDKNIQFTHKSRTSYLLTFNEDKKNLPILTNNTNDIIVYKDDLEEFNKKRKKRSWEKLLPN